MGQSHAACRPQVRGPHFPRVYEEAGQPPGWVSTLHLFGNCVDASHRIVLTVHRSLPACPGKQTTSEPVGTSHCGKNGLVHSSKSVDSVELAGDGKERMMAKALFGATGQLGRERPDRKRSHVRIVSGARPGFQCRAPAADRRVPKERLLAVTLVLYSLQPASAKGEPV